MQARVQGVWRCEGCLACCAAWVLLVLLQTLPSKQDVAVWVGEQHISSCWMVEQEKANALLLLLCGEDAQEEEGMLQNSQEQEEGMEQAQQQTSVGSLGSGAGSGVVGVCWGNSL